MKLLSRRVIKASELEVLSATGFAMESGFSSDGEDVAVELAAADELADMRNRIEEEVKEIRLEAQREAERVRKRAEEEAAAILSEAQSAAAALREEQARLGFQQGFDEGKQQGYQQGLLEGRKQGEEEVRQEWTALLRQLADTVSSAVTVRDLALERSEEDILKLSLAVAEKIIKKSISYDMSCTVGIVKAALERVNGGSSVTVRVNPNLVMAMEEHRDWLTSVKGIDKVEFVEDPSIEPGGCVVETDFGRIDGRLDTRIAEIASALMEVLENDRN